MNTVITVLGKDRTGVVARIATTLANCGANIADIHQNVIDDVFSMTMLVVLDEQVASFTQVQKSLEQDASALGMQIVIQRKEMLDFIYNV